MKAHRARTTTVTACAVHFLHDGLSDILYVLFPLWAQQFTLSFAQVGILKTSYSGAMSLFQIPAGFLAERWGEARLLAGGTLICALGFLALGMATRFEWLLLILLPAGLGSAVQHPLSSSMVSRAYEEGPRRMVLGTYNFSGDLGKMMLPAATALAVAWVGWREATCDVGILALAASAAILIILSNLAPPPAKDNGATMPVGAGGDWGIRDARRFFVLSAIHVIDNGSRTAFLTFLPFLLLAKGGTVKTVGLALGLTFTGGAVGKFVCGAVAEWLGIIRTVILTEAGTGFGILALLVIPLQPSLVMLPLLGVALNGTSSVLYGTVADLVAPERRSRSYGLFYTLGIGSGALAPTLYGFVSDWGGIQLTLTAVGLIAMVTIPLATLLRLPQKDPKGDYGDKLA
jgi:FSR family fosmidomycin resistance protein-like MFS transporter